VQQLATTYTLQLVLTRASTSAPQQAQRRRRISYPARKRREEKAEAERGPKYQKGQRRAGDDGWIRREGDG
jgi:hypothetical protein